ncbi:MAG: hypothetical protein ACRDGJ_03245, partial [Candidatus Limnocylindria bacterium]
MRDEALRPFLMVAIAALKWVWAGTGAEMTSERVEYPRIDPVGPNTDGPVPEVRRTPEQELSRPSFVPRRAQPISKPVEVLADRRLPELTQPETALDVELH